jgi:hypothetical protein
MNMPGHATFRLATFVALMLVAPSQGSAQVLHSFEDLALRVNLDDPISRDAVGVRVSRRW